MRVLVCPLDWGLGHAARCIPLIRALLANGHEVRIGAAGGGKRLLQGEFPGLEVFDFPGYRVRYARSPAWFLPVMLAQLPRVFLGMMAESLRLRRILAARPCDLVISDGRYGVRSSAVPSIFITHQVFIRVPGRFPGAKAADRLLLLLNLRLLRRFSRVWVPDYPGQPSLSGELSHGPRLPDHLEFIRPLARFGPPPEDPDSGLPLRDGPVAVDILAVVSGPEPQRTLFEAALRRELERQPGTRVLVRGLPGSDRPIAGVDGAKPAGGVHALRRAGLTVFDHLPGGELAMLLRKAGMVVARSGYTTVMELAGLGSRAVLLVPTPGQSEQEYLADHLAASGIAVKMDQKDLDLARGRALLTGAEGFAAWKREGAGAGKSGESDLAAFLAAHPLLGPADRRIGSLRVQKTGQQ